MSRDSQVEMTHFPSREMTEVAATSMEDSAAQTKIVEGI